MKILDYVGMAPEPTAKPLHYVMYVRKTSEDAETQANSLPDQIAACKEYVRIHRREDGRHSSSQTKRIGREEQQVVLNRRVGRTSIQNSANLKMGAGDLAQKDLLVRKLFLNLEINQQKRPLTNKEDFSTSSLNLNDAF